MQTIFKLNRRYPLSLGNLLGGRFKSDKGHSENQHQQYWIITIHSGLATDKLHRTAIWSAFGHSLDFRTERRNLERYTIQHEYTWWVSMSC